MKAAAIDVGTNSVKLVVGELSDGSISILRDSIIISRLGEGMDKNHTLSDAGIGRTISAIGKLLKESSKLGVGSIRAVGTSAVRDAANRDVLINGLLDNFGVNLEVISGEEESLLSYAAVALDAELGEFYGQQIAIDSGGGSTEFIFGRGEQVISSISIDIGAVRLHEKFLASDPPSGSDVKNAESFALDTLKNAVSKHSGARIIGIGGSAVNVARIIRKTAADNTAAVHSTVICSDELTGLVEMLSKMTVAQRKELTGLDPERADIILGGAVILKSALAVLGATNMIISTKGLRHGMLYGMLKRSLPADTEDSF